MNHGSMKSHIIWMLAAAGAVLVGLLLFRVNLAQALPLAVALACPLGMIGMMFMMGRGMAGHEGHGNEAGHMGHMGHGSQDEQESHEQHAGHVHETVAASIEPRR